MVSRTRRACRMIARAPARLRLEPSLSFPLYTQFVFPGSEPLIRIPFSPECLILPRHYLALLLPPKAATMLVRHRNHFLAAVLHLFHVHRPPAQGLQRPLTPAYSTNIRCFSTTSFLRLAFYATIRYRFSFLFSSSVLVFGSSSYSTTRCTSDRCLAESRSSVSSSQD